MDLPHFVKKLQQPDCSQENGSIRGPLDLGRFSSFLSALLLMISLSLANLISQQYLVFAFQLGLCLITCSHTHLQTFSKQILVRVSIP